eukprot:TRINITY_DN88012_c0_g1_i1.p1 TRINITY_DN88012_c0_g1~~TRINITY_DN88012_c0_g1_i1.p1  ORF type:complete len:360 (+),score=36.63 TRINITY_DN88012_c0_g1_i1:95-1174(+)
MDHDVEAEWAQMEYDEEAENTYGEQNQIPQNVIQATQTGKIGNGSIKSAVPPPPVPSDSWQLPRKRGRLVRDLLDCTDVPNSQRKPYIFCGYRPAPKGSWCLLRSIFTLHNETGNMWTHLIGFVYFAVAGADLLETLTNGEDAKQVQTLWVLLLVVASAFCLGSSFVYHLCTCTTNSIADCTYKMDLTGIVTLIAFSYVAGIGLGYRCFPALRLFYLIFSGFVSLCLLGPLVKPTLVSNLSKHFMICVALGVIPAGHWILFIAKSEDVSMLLPYLLSMFGCYGVGACFYMKRWPESRWPGRFDLFGQSHQIWHIFVLLASVSWFHGCSRMVQHKFICEVSQDSTTDVPMEVMTTSQLLQ